MKLELGSRRTESGEENILKRKGFKEGGKSMLFILKKKKKKKENVSNNHSSRTHSAPDWKGDEESHGRFQKLGGRGAAQCLKNFMNFSKIIFVWQQVAFKNLLSRTPDTSFNLLD